MAQQPMFNKRQMERIADAVRKVEGIAPEQLVRKQTPAAANAGNWVTITGEIEDGLYPGLVWFQNADGDWVEGGECWVVDVNGIALAEDTYYRAVLTRYAGDPSGPVFETDREVAGVDASYTVRGVVNLSDQYLGAGVKSFDVVRLPVTPGDSSGDAARLFAEDTGSGVEGLVVADNTGTTAAPAKVASLTVQGTAALSAEMFSFGASQSPYIFHCYYYDAGTPLDWLSYRDVLISTTFDLDNKIIAHGRLYAGAFYFMEDGSTFHEGATATASGLTFKGGLYVSGSVSGASYSDEEAEDAIGGMAVDTDTVDVTYTDATPELKWGVRYQLSITADASGIKLSGDSGAPGNSKYYGTNGSGTKGFHSYPKLDDLAAPDDNTDLDATTSAHGLLPKLGGGTTNFLRADGSWAAPSGGSGDVVGPASATDNAIARFDLTTGKLVQDSVVTVSDAGVIAGSLFASSGLKLLNGAGSFSISVANGATITADRVLTFSMPNANTSLTLGGNFVTSGGAMALVSTSDSTSVTLPVSGTLATTAQLVSASDSAAGMIETAIQSEMEAASSTTVAVTPGRQQYHPGTCKAWVVFEADGTLSVLASHNITSVTDNGTGDHTVNIGTDFSTANYCAVGTASQSVDATANCIVVENTLGGSRAAGTFPLYVLASNGTLKDASFISVAFFGDQA